MLEHALKTVQPGEQILAEHHNAVVRALVNIDRRLVAMGERPMEDLFVFRGVVRAVNAPASADDRTIDTVTYDVARFGRSDDSLLSATAPLNRPTKNNALVILPCQVGDFCLIIRVPDSDGTKHVMRMIQLTETVDDGAC